VAPPCGTYYGQQIDTTLPRYLGYPANPPWAVCGYTPPQIRSAYNLNNQTDGSGVTVAIVDAYASPTLFSDAQEYATKNDPSHPLASSQFSEIVPNNFNKVNACDASDWFGEQSLDVEAVHAVAPGANILYVGTKNCDNKLWGGVQKIVDKHLASIITDSWGDDAGDFLETPADRAGTDELLEMAASTGISVLFSSGDSGDEFTTVGVVAPDYPASSPWVTSVGGTSLAVGANGSQTGQFGWSTARSFLCNQTLVDEQGCTSDQLNKWLPIDLALDGGSGGGTSYDYPQPFYQKGVVPRSLSTANAGATGPNGVVGNQPMRVEPDISLDADPGTGFLEGITQTFPDGTYYDQDRIGGTSLSSPLLAGVLARVNQQRGSALGFANPSLYSLSGNSSIQDVLPAGKLDQSRSDYANSIDPSDGFLYTTRIIDYEGAEQFCDANGVCTTRNVALNVRRGYDNMTGLGAPTAGFVKALAGR
jgi:subtilase family serine protease